MMTKEKAQRITEVVVEGSQRNCRMRRTEIAGLLLAGFATAALATGPAAGQQIFKARAASATPWWRRRTASARHCFAWSAVRCRRSPT